MTKNNQQKHIYWKLRISKPWTESGKTLGDELRCSGRISSSVPHMTPTALLEVIVKLLTLPEHLSSPPVFSGVCVTRSLVLCVCFVDRSLSFCLFSFGHCVVCSSSIYGFCLPFGIFKLFLNRVIRKKVIMNVADPGSFVVPTLYSDQPMSIVRLLKWNHVIRLQLQYLWVEIGCAL